MQNMSLFLFFCNLGYCVWEHHEMDCGQMWQFTLFISLSHMHGGFPRWTNSQNINQFMFFHTKPQAPTGIWEKDSSGSFLDSNVRCSLNTNIHCPCTVWNYNWGVIMRESMPLLFEILHKRTETTKGCYASVYLTESAIQKLTRCSLPFEHFGNICIILCYTKKKACTCLTSDLSLRCQLPFNKHNICLYLHDTSQKQVELKLSVKTSEYKWESLSWQCMVSVFSQEKLCVLFCQH